MSVHGTVRVTDGAAVIPELLYFLGERFPVLGFEVFEVMWRRSFYRLWAVAVLRCRPSSTMTFWSLGAKEDAFANVVIGNMGISWANYPFDRLDVFRAAAKTFAETSLLGGNGKVGVSKYQVGDWKVIIQFSSTLLETKGRFV